MANDNYIDNNKYNDMTVKQLKRELSILKKDQMNGTEIKYVSKLIRNKLNKNSNTDRPDNKRTKDSIGKFLEVMQQDI